MKEKGIAAVPTMVRYKFVNSRGGYLGSTSRRFTLSDELIMETGKRMRKAGIKMGVGLDLVRDPRMMPGPYIDELQNFVALGYGIEEALVAATRTNAEILGIDDKLGTIEPGKLADIIAVRGRPDQRLEDLANVDLVLVNGRVRVRQGSLYLPPHEMVQQ
jgi:imidazolonepropionase-like amidohydrolase